MLVLSLLYFNHIYTFFIYFFQFNFSTVLIPQVTIDRNGDYSDDISEIITFIETMGILLKVFHICNALRLVFFLSRYLCIFIKILGHGVGNSVQVFWHFNT